MIIIVIIIVIITLYVFLRVQNTQTTYAKLVITNQFPQICFDRQENMK